MHVASYFARKSARGGVFIMARKELKFISLDNINKLSIESHFEITAVKLLESNSIIVCLYRPPNGDINIFYDKLYVMLNSFKYNHVKIFIGGDYNVHFNVSSATSNSTVDAFKSFGFESTVNFCTRGKYILDNVFTNCKLLVPESYPFPFHSDHTGVFLRLPIKCKLPVKEQPFRLTRPLSGMGRANFFTCVTNAN